MLINEQQQEERQRNLLVDVIEQLNEAVIITDGIWRIAYVNRVFVEWSGYSKEEIIGQPFFCVVNEASESVLIAHADRVESEKAPFVEKISNRRKDGSAYSVFARTAPIFDDDGEVIGFVSTHRDITRENQLEKDLRQAQKMEALGTLAAGIAHDFNNILTSSIAFSRIALEKNKAGGNAEKEISNMLMASLRAADMVKQILLYSRKTEPFKKPISLIEIVNDAVSLLGAAFPDTVAIQVLIDGKVSGSDIVMADKSQMLQVVMNLGTNAEYAMRESSSKKLTFGLALEVSSNAGNPVKRLKITVKDTGRGMDHYVVERIFDPYFTTKINGDGSGMGLAVVQGIVRGHGGSISVESKPGEGSEFCIMLPALDRTA
jgi:two-component system, cell cycle sensor histidine kinase and response regulator CckA